MKQNILIVDYDQSRAQLVSSYLQLFNCPCDLSLNHADSLTKVDRKNYNKIFISNAEASYLALIEFLKNETTPSSHAKIYLLAHKLDSPLPEKLAQAIDYVISNPYELDTILETAQNESN